MTELRFFLGSIPIDPSHIFPNLRTRKMVDFAFYDFQIFYPLNNYYLVVILIKFC